MLLTRDYWLHLITAMVTGAPVSGYFPFGTLGLFTNDVNPGIDAVLGDFVEPGSPYARKAVTVSGAFTMPDGRIWVHIADVPWAEADLPAPPLTFYGAMLVSSGMGPHVEAVGRFREPIVYSRVTDAFVVSADLIFDPNADVGPWLTEP